MTIEKAIKILEGELRYYNEIAQPDALSAHELAIEALKAWREARREGRWPSSMRLPGETKE